MSVDVRTEDQTEVESQPRVKPPFPYYTVTLIVCILAVAAVQFYIDGSNSILFGGERSSRLAGFVKPSFANGEYWRILTGAAVHGGIIHLAVNTYALFGLGRLFESLSSRAHLVIVFLLSAIGGGLMGLIFMPNGTSVGASGGIVGFLGYLAVYGWLRRAIIPSSFLKNMLFNIGLMVFIGLSINARNQGLKIDNYGHFGGLITGALYGLIQIPSDIYKDPRKTSKTVDLIGLVALGIFIAVSMFAIFVMLRA